MKLCSFYKGNVDYTAVIYYNCIVCNDERLAQNAKVIKRAGIQPGMLNERTYENHGRIETIEYNPSSTRANNGL